MPFIQTSGLQKNKIIHTPLVSQWNNWNSK